MSLETEAVFKELNKFLQENRESIKSEDDMQRMAEEFIRDYNKHIPKKSTPSTANDYLILASKPETTKSQALSYTKKALELEPDNLDARLKLIALENMYDPNKRLEELDKLIKKADEEYTKTNTFERYMGNFWQFYETRPYMRVREAHVTTLIECGMMTEAIKECKEMMKLNKDDNLGIRYTLAPLYAYMENEKSLVTLSKKSQKDSQVLLALSVLYYKLRDYDKAKEYLSKLAEVNKDTKKFLRAVINDDTDSFYETEFDGGYRPWTIEELGEAYLASSFLYSIMEPYFYWAYQAISKK